MFTGYAQCDQNHDLTKQQDYDYGYNLNNRSLTSVQSDVNGNNLENKFVYTRGYMTEAEHDGFKYNFA